MAARSGRFAARQVLLGEPLEAARGVHSLLGLSRERLESTMSGGAVEIEREVLAHSTEQEGESGHPNRDEDGWTDAEWIKYLRHEPASEQKLSGEQRTRDKGRDGWRLADFAEHTLAKNAGLSEAQVLALRLYTSGVSRSINTPLIVGCTEEKPHPLPALVGHLVSALKQLRSKAKELPFKGKGGHLFRGMRDLDVSEEFIERGGCERGLISALSDRANAVRDAARLDEAPSIVLLKIKADDLANAAPDLSWCSCIDLGEAGLSRLPITEHVYPPLTHMRPLLSGYSKKIVEETKKVDGRDVLVRILEVECVMPEF